MMECVEKDYVLAVLRLAARGASLSATMRIEEAYKKIQQSPAEKVEPIVEAEWIRDERGFCICSHCGATCPYEFSNADHIEYWPDMLRCHRCGAHMNRGKDEPSEEVL